MIDYASLKVEELIKLARTSDDGAFGEILNRYTPMLVSEISDFLSSQVTYDAAYSEACFALHRATMSYDLSRSEIITFGLYAQICVHRRLCDLAEKESRGVEIADTDVDRLVVKSGLEAGLIRRESMERYLEIARSLLSDYEYQVFYQYVRGKKNSEIAEELSKSVKSIENAKHRIFKRLEENRDKFSGV